MIFSSSFLEPTKRCVKQHLKQQGKLNYDKNQYKKL